MDYTFVYKYGGWWLKVNSYEKLADYHQQTADFRWNKAYENLLNSKDFFPKTGKEHTGPLAYAIYHYALNRNISMVEGMSRIHKDMLDAQFKGLDDGYDLYINRIGGWHVDSGKPYTQFYTRKKLLFPNFTKNNLIRISQFPMGQHYYAYIDDMQVRDRDKLKWDTYDEAYEYAKKFIEENKD